MSWFAHTTPRATRLALWLMAASLPLLSGCGPDFTIECAGAQPVIDGEPFTCDRCFAVVGCERQANGVLECPSGVRTACTEEGGEFCCDGDCVTCP